MADEWWADYSAGTLPAAALRAHGYVGVIRYVDAPERMNPPGALQKHTTKAEFDEHRQAGLRQLLVYQGDTTDADSGRPGGIRNAQRARAGCAYLGYDGPVFFANDRTTVPNPGAWQDYVDGAASILGRDQVGAYGFANALTLAVGHASLFWQAGRHDDVVPHAHLWQDNNTQVVVNGVTTDRNLVLKPIPAGGGALASSSQLILEEYAMNKSFRAGNVKRNLTLQVPVKGAGKVQPILSFFNFGGIPRTPKLTIHDIRFVDGTGHQRTVERGRGVVEPGNPWWGGHDNWCVPKAGEVTLVVEYTYDCPTDEWGNALADASLGWREN